MHACAAAVLDGGLALSAAKLPKGLTGVSRLAPSAGESPARGQAICAVRAVPVPLSSTSVIVKRQPQGQDITKNQEKQAFFTIRDEYRA